MKLSFTFNLTWLWKELLLLITCMSKTYATYLCYSCCFEGFPNWFSVFLLLCIIQDIVSTYALTKWDLSSVWSKKATSLENLKVGTWIVGESVEIFSLSSISGVLGYKALLGLVWLVLCVVPRPKLPCLSFSLSHFCELTGMFCAASCARQNLWEAEMPKSFSPCFYWLVYIG